MTPKHTRSDLGSKHVQRCSLAPLSIEELEIGLLSLGRDDLDLKEFWDANIVGFRQTVLLAIRETSDALLSPKITLRERIELQNELDALVRYIKLADRYIARRSFTLEQRSAGSTTH